MKKLTPLVLCAIIIITDGFYLFWARGYNQCGGWSEWVDTELEFTDCSGMMLMMYPNPTTSETTLTLMSNSEEIKLDENEEWEIEVYSESFGLKEKKTKLKDNTQKLKTAGWTEGVYTVRVKYKNEILTGKLVVQK